MSVLAFFFAWPDGAVYGNLVASVICAGLIWWRIRARMIAHHLELLAQNERLHKALKAHITAAALAPRPVARQAKTLITRQDRKEKPGGDPT